MAALRIPLRKPRDIYAELKYWRNVRLDRPWMKDVAIREIDKLLDTILEGVCDGAGT